MGIRIYQLPSVIANQIAAGEVIERPASVVKELLENSYDAGATSISIEIGFGGLNQIKVSDNGLGIVAEDLPLAIEAHATSKIRKLDDLYAISSMGFRGEALASIASIAKLCISSKTEEQEHAMMIKAEGGNFSLVPCARATGTTVDICDIFFNAPVRKRFLKNEKIEFQAIETVVKRFALSALHVAISLKHNSKPIFLLPAASTEQEKLTRMSKIFGNSFVHDAIFLDVEHAGICLNGWISGPKYQRSQNDRQWVYINQRMVKDKLINHAIKQAYDEVIHPGRFPACLLYLTINSSEVDVNVHPTKHEVRFQQPRLIHDLLTSQLTAALKSKDFEKVEAQYAHSQKLSIAEPPSSVFDWNNPSAQYLQKGLDCTMSSWVFLNQRYVLILIQQQYHLVDIKKLYQQWVLSQLKNSKFPLAARPLLVPVSYNIAKELADKIPALQQLLLKLALHIEVLHQHTVVIRTIPIQAPYLDLRLFFDTIIQLEHFDLEVLINELSALQVFDPRLLSDSERMDLNNLLFSSHFENNLSKLLTEEECRKFLHV